MPLSDPRGTFSECATGALGESRLPVGPVIAFVDLFDLRYSLPKLESVKAEARGKYLSFGKNLIE